MRTTIRRLPALLATLASLVALALAGGGGFRGW